MSSFADGKFENQSIYTIKNNKVNDHKNDYMYAHPKVIQWLCDSDLKYEGSKHINCSNYIQNAQKAFKNINEIGINSLVDAYSITTNQADKLYEKKKKLHGVKFKNKKHVFLVMAKKIKN